MKVIILRFNFFRTSSKNQLSFTNIEHGAHCLYAFMATLLVRSSSEASTSATALNVPRRRGRPGGGLGVQVAHRLQAAVRIPIPSCSSVAAFAEKISSQAAEDFNVTGLSVGVVCNHSVVFVGGVGLADAHAGTPATEHTLYQVASNTKAFTAMVALQMVQEGKLNLDAPARDANAAWRVADEYGSASITPRDMMSHRTARTRVQHPNLLRRLLGSCLPCLCTT